MGAEVALTCWGRGDSVGLMMLSAPSVRTRATAAAQKLLMSQVQHWVAATCAPSVQGKRGNEAQGLLYSYNVDHSSGRTGDRTQSYAWRTGCGDWQRIHQTGARKKQQGGATSHPRSW